MKQESKRINNHSLMILMFTLFFISLACIKFNVNEKKQKEVVTPIQMWNMYLF